MEVIRRNTDYALRMLVRLARDAGRDTISARELAEAEGVPVQYAAKVLRQLSAAALVSSRMGKNGGFALKRTPADVTLAQVIQAIQGPVILNRCVAMEGVCPFQSKCSICKRLKELQTHVDATLAGATLAELAMDVRQTQPAVQSS